MKTLMLFLLLFAYKAEGQFSSVQKMETADCLEQFVVSYSIDNLYFHQLNTKVFNSGIVVSKKTYYSKTLRHKVAAFKSNGKMYTVEFNKVMERVTIYSGDSKKELFQCY